MSCFLASYKNLITPVADINSLDFRNATILKLLNTTDAKKGVSYTFSTLLSQYKRINISQQKEKNNTGE